MVKIVDVIPGYASLSVGKQSEWKVFVDVCSSMFSRSKTISKRRVLHSLRNMLNKLNDCSIQGHIDLIIEMIKLQFVLECRPQMAVNNKV